MTSTNLPIQHTVTLTTLQVQRAIGALVGSAVGDALGAPFEFGPPGQYSKQFPEPVVGGVGEMRGGGGFRWSPGEFTDDTQMALALAESLIACGGLDAVDTIDAWRAEGRNLLVHCHGGRSRTALVLKAWAMRRQGWTETEAHQWLERQWHRYDPWNHTFSDFLRTEWPA